MPLTQQQMLDKLSTQGWSPYETESGLGGIRQGEDLRLFNENTPTLEDMYSGITGDRTGAGLLSTQAQAGNAWKDKMGQYSQGTLALEKFGGITGNGIAIVDANTGEWLTRVGDPGWDNMQALYDAGYTKFANDDGTIGTFEDFGRELGLRAQGMEQANKEGSTGLGGTNTLRNIISGVGSTAIPALVGPLSKLLKLSPSIVHPGLAAGLAAGTGGNPLLAAAQTVLMDSIMPRIGGTMVPESAISSIEGAGGDTPSWMSEGYNAGALAAETGGVQVAGPSQYGEETLDTTVPDYSGAPYADVGSGITNGTNYTLPTIAGAGVAGIGALSGMGQDTGSGYDFGMTGDEGSPTVTEGGSIGGGDYGGTATGGYTQPAGTSFGTEGGVVAPTPSWWDSAWGKFDEFSKSGLGKFLLGNIGTNKGFLGQLFGNVLDANTMRSLYADLDKTMNRAIDVSSPFRNEYPKYQPTLYNTVMNPSQYLEEPEGIPQQIAKATRQTVSPGGGYLSGREQNAVAHSLFDTYDKRVSQLGNLSGAQFGPGQAGQVAATMGTQAANARAGSMFPYGDVLRSLFGRS